MLSLIGIMNKFYFMIIYIMQYNYVLFFNYSMYITPNIYLFIFIFFLIDINELMYIYITQMHENTNIYMLYIHAI